ncbi:S41 family peptidase [Sphingobacterium sp. HJSM2_6]|uniref:S41 family peptidase n=1 Tax=Sphingobacterium sp. HJSM2_6 TaxID=3366264 RepID=UPI003BBCDD8A
MKNTLLIFGLLTILFYSCKKEEKIDKNYENEILLKDSTYYYSFLISLWTDKIPEPSMLSEDEIDLKKYTNKFNDAEAVLTDLKKNYMPDDRFSFIDREKSVSTQIGQGVFKETGVNPIYLLDSENSSNANLYIKFVQKGSPADRAGLVRGMKILSINGDNKVDFNSGRSNGHKLFYKFYSGETLKLEVLTVDNKTSTITVTGSDYKMNPIKLSSIINLNDKKVGYLAYSSFISVTTQNQPNSYYQDLINNFKTYETAGIDELVVDLRYNGGGSTETAELLANLIAPKTANKDKMYDYQINRYLTAWGWNDPKNTSAPFLPVYFNKTNQLDLQRVYFLVTESTASASELVINVLRPYMDVQIISTQNMGTYGKPVGYFALPVVNGYADLYITSFKMTNKAGFGDYFQGLSGTKKNANESFSLQLGDSNEGLLNEALYHINFDTYRTLSASASLKKSTKTKDKYIIEQAGQPKDLYKIGMYKFSKQFLPNVPH